MSRTFGRKTAYDKLIVLQEKLANLEKDRENIDLATNLAGDSWHICDWVFKEAGGRIGYPKLRSLQDYVKLQCSSLALMQDICTEDKHSEVTRWTPSIDEARQEHYVEPGYWEEGYAEAPLMIITAQKSNVLFLDAARDVVGFWQEFFIRHGIT